jgi:hypothetical protein
MPAVAQMAPYGSPNTAPPAYQSNAYPAQGYTSQDWSQRNYGSTSGTTTAPSGAGTTVAVEPPPRVDPGDPHWNPIQNLREAELYDRLLETDPSFRAARIRKGCGPITDPPLRADCIASFDRFEPLVASTATAAPRRMASSRHHPSHNVGSSAAPKHYQSSSGR